MGVDVVRALSAQAKRADRPQDGCLRSAPVHGDGIGASLPAGVCRATIAMPLLWTLTVRASAHAISTRPQSISDCQCSTGSIAPLCPSAVFNMITSGRTSSRTPMTMEYFAIREFASGKKVTKTGLPTRSVNSTSVGGKPYTSSVSQPCKSTWTWCNGPQPRTATDNAMAPTALLVDKFMATRLARPDG